MTEEKKLALWEDNIIIRTSTEIFNNDNNKVIVIGEIEEEPKYDPMLAGYRSRIISERISGTKDFIPIVLKQKQEKGVTVAVEGEFWSKNNKPHLDLFVFVKNINICTNTSTSEVYKDLIYLEGFICKPPIYRITPLGRNITELLIAVDLPKRSVYIPCIVWGYDALEASEYSVGMQVQLYGRIQSRQYIKRSTGEIREAYEVSVYVIKETGINNREREGHLF